MVAICLIVYAIVNATSIFSLAFSASRHAKVVSHYRQLQFVSSRMYRDECQRQGQLHWGEHFSEVVDLSEFKI